jgi:hypothetical protein
MSIASKSRAPQRRRERQDMQYAPARKCGPPVLNLLVAYFDQSHLHRFVSPVPLSKEKWANVRSIFDFSAKNAKNRGRLGGAELDLNSRPLLRLSIAKLSANLADYSALIKAAELER